MKFSHLCALSFGALMLFGCTNSKYSSPVLIERGVGQNEYEREYFISKESMGIDKHLQNTFKQGYIEEGMTTDMVNLLWGPPDHETADGMVWEYFTREGKLITRLFWKYPEQARLKAYEGEKILDKIEGDRYGGSPAPSSSRSSTYDH
jgi:hypothetical protein